MLAAVKSLFDFCTTERIVLIDPVRAVELPKRGRRLPRGVLTPKEMSRVMRQPDLDTCAGLRDRAILETLYSTGVRNAELRRLTLADVDLERGYITVINGMNKKDRVVPLGKSGRALHPRVSDEGAAEADARSRRANALPHRAGTADDGLDAADARRAAWQSGERRRRVSPHGIRHTCATAMLNGKADIRFIQEMLGHESLTSTEIYTHVAISDLKRVHARAHPRERDLPADAEWDRTRR